MKPTDEVLAPGEGPTDAQLEIMPRADGAERFQPLALTISAAKASALALVVSKDDTPEEQKRKSAEARRLRLDVFRATRITAEKLHKELKSGILEIGRKLDGAERELRRECEHIEEHLLEQEQFAAREAQRLEDERRQARAAELAPYLSGPIAVDLGKIDEEHYQKLLADSKDLFDLRLKREEEAKEAARKAAEEEERQRKAEEERLRKEAEERAAEVARLKAEAAAKEKERLAELERLKKEQAEREAKAKAEREAAEKRAAEELRALEEKNRLEREKREAEAAAERKRLEEENRKQREAAEKERQERARLEAEAKAKADAERKAREKEERERRKAEAAPDVDKIIAWAAAIEALRVPKIGNEVLAGELVEKHDAFANWIRRQAEKLSEGALL